MSRVFIIAEAGVNHNGDIGIAKQLIDAAKDAGADAVKFQTFKTENLVSRTAAKAEYQKKTTSEDESQFDMLKRLEFDRETHLELARHCRMLDIEFLSTAFDFESIELLRELGIDLWKIPSGEITNLPYLRRVGALGKPILLSTGMATLGEVEGAIEILESAGTSRQQITVLHCTTEYPAPIEEVNLRAMVTMGQALGVKFGYSDHTPGITVPIAAVALGAQIIEKHFTLDKKMEGPDHKASLEPIEMRKMIEGIRTAEAALGDGIKRPTVTEIRNRLAARKSIVAAKNIEAGELLTDENITVKRPGSGISPMEWDQLIGRKTQRSYLPDETISWQDYYEES